MAASRSLLRQLADARGPGRLGLVGKRRRYVGIGRPGSAGGLSMWFLGRADSPDSASHRCATRSTASPTAIWSARRCRCALASSAASPPAAVRTTTATRRAAGHPRASAGVQEGVISCTSSRTGTRGVRARAVGVDAVADLGRDRVVAESSGGDPAAPGSVSFCGRLSRGREGWSAPPRTGQPCGCRSGGGSAPSTARPSPDPCCYAQVASLTTAARRRAARASPREGPVGERERRRARRAARRMRILAARKFCARARRGSAPHSLAEKCRRRRAFTARAHSHSSCSRSLGDLRLRPPWRLPLVPAACRRRSRRARGAAAALCAVANRVRALDLRATA